MGSHVSLHAPADAPPTHDGRPSLARAERWAARLSWAALALVVVVLAGWALEVPVLTTVAPGLASTKVNTAVCVGLLAVVGVLPRPAPRGLSPALLGAALLIATLSLAEEVLSTSLGIDELLVPDPGGGPTPGRMAGSTAVCLVLLALAMLTGRRPVVSQLLALGGWAISYVGMLGYLYGVQDLYNVGPFSTMALGTATVLGLLAVIAQLRVPGGIAQWVVAGHDAGALLVRQVLPVLVVGLPVMGLIRLQAERAGLIGPRFGLAVTITVTVLVMTAALIQAGRGTRRLDAQREAALRELEDLNSDLERRVREGAARLERQHTHLALRNDRDRIARDLHDRVIQRLFAGGLQLAALQRLVRVQAFSAEQVSAIDDRIEVVIDELNEVVQELRESIFALNATARSASAVLAARAVVDQAGRVLPFTPQVVVHESVEHLPGGVLDHLVAVLRETVSNIARHADATEAWIEVGVQDGVLRVLVEDDGVGMPAELPRSSGVRNLQARAESLGGRARWQARAPRGTRVTWQAPVERPGTG